MYNLKKKNESDILEKCFKCVLGKQKNIRRNYFCVFVFYIQLSFVYCIQFDNNNNNNNSDFKLILLPSVPPLDLSPMTLLVFH